MMTHSSAHESARTTSTESVSVASVSDSEESGTTVCPPSKVWLVLAVLLVLAWWSALLVMGLVLC